MPKSKETEEQIFEAARTIFQRSGYAGARMQEIADEAGINKSMLHYYFRSKDKLFLAVFRESAGRFLPVISKVLNSDLALVPKVEKLIETYHNIFRENPYLPRFVIHEMSQNPERFKAFLSEHGPKPPTVFIRQVREEVRAGTMRPIKPEEFIINTISLCVFPFIARHMIEVVFGMDDQEYQRFIEVRKNELSKFIFNAVTK